MADKVGPFRTDAKLRSAISAIAQLKAEIGDTVPVSTGAAFDPMLTDWLDLRNMLLVAQSVAMPALARTESRGAHQREDHPGLDDGLGRQPDRQPVTRRHQPAQERATTERPLA